VTGLDGDLGSKWAWDAYYQHGENENHQRLFNNMVGSLAGPAVRQYDFLRWALDSVRSNPTSDSSTWNGAAGTAAGFRPAALRGT